MDAPPVGDLPASRFHAKLTQLETALGMAFTRPSRKWSALASSCLLSKGHLLIEDVPGVGKKTTLAHALARGGAKRVPAGSVSPPTCCLAIVLGVTIYITRTLASLSLNPGRSSPHFLLADEIKPRDAPKPSRPCWEAMNERQITIDGRSYPLFTALHG